jgi:hypothetical protein
MASIFTGLAFMHGHIVNRELIFRLGREEAVAESGAGSQQAADAASKPERKPVREIPAHPACASC